MNQGEMMSPGDLNDSFSDDRHLYGFGNPVMPFTICYECSMEPIDLETAEVMRWLENPPGNGSPINVFIPRRRVDFAGPRGKVEAKITGKIYRAAACKRCRRLIFVEEQ